MTGEVPCGEDCDIGDVEHEFRIPGEAGDTRPPSLTFTRCIMRFSSAPPKRPRRYLSK